MSEPEFKNRPKPSDWKLDESMFNGGLDPVAKAFLTENAWDDVPIPLIFNFTREMADKVEQLKLAEDIAPALDEITARIAEEQSRFPDSPVWDRSRHYVVESLIEMDEADKAADYALTMTSPHAAADTLVQIFEQTNALPVRVSERLLRDIETNEHYAGIFRAWRDSIIIDRPLSDNLDIFNRVLVAHGIEEDNLLGWVDSQQKAHPDWQWESILQSIQMDEHWTGVPVPVRQHVMWHYTAIQEEIVNKKIPEDEHDEWLQVIVNLVDVLEDNYPEAGIMSHIRGNIAVDLVEEHPELAIKMAGSIRNSHVGARIVMEFLDKGKEEEALEVATWLHDYKLTAELLLDLDWQNEDAALARLSDIVQDDEYPIEKRVGVLQALIDRMISSSQQEMATKYIDILKELKDQLD